MSCVLPRGTKLEIWFQDEARVGQKNGITRQWAPKGSRPRQPKDQRYTALYIFGAVCPQRDIGAALVMPYADTKAMQLHLEEISLNVATGAHAIVVMPLGDCPQSPAGNRWGRLAYNRKTQNPRQHLAIGSATLQPRIEPG